ncbi:fumarylacetoacetate hydrolase family protein [Xylophilus sp. GW821-FHT01B05]
MRFLRFKDGERLGLAVATAHGGFAGWLEDDAGYPGDLTAGLLASSSLKDLAGRLCEGRPVDPDKVQRLPPLAKAGKIICVGLNYLDHAAESGHKVPEYPTIFSRFETSLIGDGAPLLKPHCSDQFDYEGELVAVIGKRGRNISRADALQHVIAYSIFNDGSIRDYQLRTPQWTMGKNFDSTGAFGPLLVSADELPAGARGLRIETRLNGQVVQSANTDQMVFDVAHLVASLSETMTLEPGDVIVTGTPSGVGMARKPQLWMKVGDICEVEIEQIGVLRNQVKSPPAP